MKQQQSNIIEAQAAIRRADESVLQGRSIVVFTVVTIFFVSSTYRHFANNSLIKTASTVFFRQHFWHERTGVQLRWHHAFEEATYVYV